MFEARIAELNRFNEQNPVSYDKRTYTVDEIQDILGISRPTAYNLVKQGVFHSVRVGGHILFVLRKIGGKRHLDVLFHISRSRSVRGAVSRKL